MAVSELEKYALIKTRITVAMISRYVGISIDLFHKCLSGGYARTASITIRVPK